MLYMGKVPPISIFVHGPTYLETVQSQNKHIKPTQQTESYQLVSRERSSKEITPQLH